MKEIYRTGIEERTKRNNLMEVIRRGAMFAAILLFLTVSVLAAPSQTMCEGDEITDEAAPIWLLEVNSQEPDQAFFNVVDFYENHSYIVEKGTPVYFSEIDKNLAISDVVGDCTVVTISEVPTPTPTPTPEPTPVPTPSQMPIISGDRIIVNGDEENGIMVFGGKNYSVAKINAEWQITDPRSGLSLTKEVNGSWTVVRKSSHRKYSFGKNPNSTIANQWYMDEVLYNSTWSLKLLFEKYTDSNGSEYLVLPKITYNDPEGNVVMEGIVGNYTAEGYVNTLVKIEGNSSVSYIGTNRIKWETPKVLSEGISSAQDLEISNVTEYFEFYNILRDIFMPDLSNMSSLELFGGFGGSRGAVKLLPLENLIQKRLGGKVAEKVAAIELGPGSELTNTFSISDTLGKGRKVVAIEQELFYVEAQKNALASSKYANDVRFVLGDFTRMDNFVSERIISLAPYPAGIENVIATSANMVEGNGGKIYIATDTGFLAKDPEKYINLLNDKLKERGLRIKESKIGAIDPKKVETGDNEMGIPLKSKYNLEDRLFAVVEKIPVVSI